MFSFWKTPFDKQYAGSRKRTHQATERSLGTSPEQFGNNPFEVLSIRELIRRGAGWDDDFAPSEPAGVNGECARSQKDEGNRNRHRKEAGDPG
jgi:hypothetical protein